LVEICLEATQTRFSTLTVIFLPWLTFFRAFFSVVRPGYNSQRNTNIYHAKYYQIWSLLMKIRCRSYVRFNPLPCQWESTVGVQLPGQRYKYSVGRYDQYEKQTHNWIGAYFESITTILLIIGGMMYYTTYIL